MKLNKTWLLSLMLTAMLCIGLTYALTQANQYVHRDPQFTANVWVLHEGVSGKEMLPAGNVITDIAETGLRNLLGFDNDTWLDGTNKTDYISVGNCTPAAALTKITTECDNSSAFGRAQGTVTAWANGTDAAYNVTKTFTANATVTIDSAGLNWFWSDGSDNNLFAVAAIAQTAFAVGDNCTITWVITFDAN
jgi:hypothetical protein